MYLHRGWEWRTLCVFLSSVKQKAWDGIQTHDFCIALADVLSLDNWQMTKLARLLEAVQTLC